MTDYAGAGLTLTEVVKRHDPNGNMSVIVDALKEENGILEDALWKEANDRFGHKSTRWALEPSGQWRRLNSGITQERGETVEVYDTIGILESRSEPDKDLIESFKNPKQARHDEAMAAVRGMGKTMTHTMLYGNTAADPEKFNGLDPRLDALDTTNNILNGGASGSSTTSVFVVDWGPDTVFMAYPLNSDVGLDHEDRGIEVVTDSSVTDSSKKYRAYVDWFQWKAGMVVRNFEAVGRVANISPSGDSNTFDEDDLITLLNRMTKGPGRRIYCSQNVLTQMEIRLKDKGNMYFTKKDGLAPGLDLLFKNVPIRLVEQISETEAALEI